MRVTLNLEIITMNLVVTQNTLSRSLWKPAFYFKRCCNKGLNVIVRKEIAVSKILSQRTASGRVLELHSVIFFYFIFFPKENDPCVRMLCDQKPLLFCSLKHTGCTPLCFLHCFHSTLNFHLKLSGSLRYCQISHTSWLLQPAVAGYVNKILDIFPNINNISQNLKAEQ